jgi:hypothetical protein
VGEAGCRNAMKIKMNDVLVCVPKFPAICSAPAADAKIISIIRIKLL